MGKFIDAVRASGKNIPDDALALLEHFEAVLVAMSEETEAKSETTLDGIRGLIKANSKELAEHKDTLLKAAAKIDAQVDNITSKITSKEAFRKAIEARAEDLKNLSMKNEGRVSLSIQAAASDPVLTDPNYPEGLPIPRLAPGIGRIPMLMSSYLDYVDSATYGRRAAPITFVDETPYEGDAEWWTKKNPDGSWMQKADVTFGEKTGTAIPKVVAVKTKAFKYDLIDFERLENEIYTRLIRLLHRAVRKAILTGNETVDPKQPNGAWTIAVPYNNPGATGTVQFANVVDAISKMVCQIRQAGYEGRIVASVSPSIACEMNTLKANNGVYLDYSQALADVSIVTDMALTGNQVLVSIPENYHVQFYGGIEIDIIVGSVKDADGNVIGTTDEYNMVEFRAEQRLIVYSFTNDKPSFVKSDDIKTVVDDINIPTA